MIIGTKLSIKAQVSQTQARTDDDPWICGDTCRENLTELHIGRADERSDVLPTLFLQEKLSHEAHNSLHLQQVETAVGKLLLGAWGLLVASLSQANPALTNSLISSFNLVEACRAELKRSLHLVKGSANVIKSFQPAANTLKAKNFRKAMRAKLLGLRLSSVLDSCLMVGHNAYDTLIRQAQSAWSDRMLESTVRSQLAGVCPLAAIIES